MASAIQTSLNDRLPIRAVIIDGRRRNVDNPSGAASQVSKRLLDPMKWTVTSYDWKTGDCTMARGAHKFVDQFSVQQESEGDPARREVSSQAFVRSASVRTGVLMRANGKCELCREPGFKMPDGKIYLETHHVVPLKEKGPDTEKNVAALCPNHHCEAHYGLNKRKIRVQLLSYLNTL